MKAPWKACEVSKRRALALQQELLAAFVAPDFQKDLHQLARQGLKEALTLPLVYYIAVYI